MNYYDIWEDMLQLKLDVSPFARGFLIRCNTSTIPITNGEDADMQSILRVLPQIPLEILFQEASSLGGSHSISAAEVPCFSTLENGLSRIEELLSFAPQGMSYTDLGYKMVKSSNMLAQIKYGENHSKIAAMMETVKISEGKPAIVRNTALGEFVITLPQDMRNTILRRTLLRNRFIQYFLSKIINTNATYVEIVSCLSASTAYRRRTSVKQLMEFLLTDTSWESYLINLDWEVPQ